MTAGGQLHRQCRDCSLKNNHLDVIGVRKNICRRIYASPCRRKTAQQQAAFNERRFVFLSAEIRVGAATAKTRACWYFPSTIS